MSKPRFGPEREAALSLDNLPVDVPEPEQIFTASVDWDSVVRNAGMTAFETRVFRHHWKRSVPLAQLHAALNCTPAQAERGYRTVLRKLRAFGWNAGVTYKPITNSLRLTFSEKLPGGHRVRSLSPLGPEFVQIMNAEKCFGLFSQRNQADAAREHRTAQFYPRAIGAKMAKVESIDLYSQRAQVRKRVSELTISYIGFDAEAKRLRRERWTLQAGKPVVTPDSASFEAIEQAADKFLADPQADPETVLGLSGKSLDIRIRAAEKRRDVTATARGNAQRLLNEIDAKITAAEVPAKVARLQPQAAELRRAFDALVQLNAAYAEKCATEGVAVDPFADLPNDIRSNASVVLHQFARLEQMLIGYGVKRVKAA